MSKLSALGIGCAAAVAMAAPLGPMPLHPTVAHARSSCLMMDRASVRIDGLLRAGGRESVFEHRVVVRVRGASGQQSLRTAVIGRDGRWSISIFVSSPRDQTGTVEVLSIAPKDGKIACLARRQVRLPFNSPVGQRLVYRAHADVDGDGRADLVTLRKTSQTRGRVDVTLAGGRRVSLTTQSFGAARPGLVRVGNVDGRAGTELFVELAHVSTSNSIGVVTFRSGHLRLAGVLPTSAHAGLFAGITCGRSHSQPVVTQHAFVLRPQMGTPRYWTRTDSRYVWRASRLVLDHTGKTVRLPWTPPPGLVGVQCGHRPAT